MKTIVLILFYVMVAYARPDAGYNYNAPNQLVSNNRIQSGIGNYNKGSTGNFNSNSDNTGNFGFGTSNQGLNNGFSSSGSGSGFGVPGLGGSGSSGSFNGGNAGQQTIIQKHIYVHVPPPEQEEIRPQQHIASGIAQKHYKIIFIKAPSAPTPSQAQLALAAQSQEKTIVYVLVKKPDDIAESIAAQSTVTQPSKPEVYFIKYKSQRGSGGGGAGAGAGGAGGGGGGVGGGISVGFGSSSSASGTAISSLAPFNFSGIGGSQGIGGSSNTGHGTPSQQYGPSQQSGPY